MATNGSKIPRNSHIQMVERAMGFPWETLRELYSTKPGKLANIGDKDRYELVQQLMRAVETCADRTERATTARELLGAMGQDRLTPAEVAIFTNPDILDFLRPGGENRTGRSNRSTATKDPFSR